MISSLRFLAISLLISQLLLTQVGRAQPDAPELSAIASMIRQEQQKTPGGLLVDRLVFNEYLLSLPRPFIVQARLKPEQIEEIKRLAKRRADALVAAIEALTPGWIQISPEEKQKKIDDVVKDDEREVQALVDALDEILAPHQRQALATAVMTKLSEVTCGDPIIRHWVGLTEQEANQVRERFEISSRFLVNTWRELGVPLSTPLPEDKELEYQRLYVLMWEGLSSEKLKRILVYSSLLLDDENLADYVERSPRSAAALIKHIPAFAESVQQRDKAKAP